MAVSEGSTEVEAFPLLVARCLMGCPSGWRTLIDRFSPLVWSITRSFRLAQHDREDVYQATWANVVSHLADLQAPERLPAWIATTARRECLKQIARSSRHVPVGDDAVLDAVDPAEETTVHQVLRLLAGQEVRAAFSQLPERDQRLLGLLMSDAAPNYDTISCQLGLPRGSIGPMRGRALTRLRGLLPSTAESWVA
ncbi:RNA polymerase sigma factor [Nocardia sp. NPDC127579]|uniref:RNA polymerase sigma factor n=1 Tax=Nocardia sp. NPDC127579 TaxID=3345402 RepID=UPI003628CFC3